MTLKGITVLLMILVVTIAAFANEHKRIHVGESQTITDADGDKIRLSGDEAVRSDHEEEVDVIETEVNVTN